MIKTLRHKGLKELFENRNFKQSNAPANTSGELLREEVLPHLEISDGHLAELVGVSRQTINEIVTEKRSVSMDMASRFGKLFNMDPSTWIRMHEAVDA